MSEWSRGFAAMIAVCVTWGMSPIFYHALGDVPVLEVLAHRTIWSLVLFVLILGVQGRLDEFRAALAGPWLGRVVLAALLISANWGIFIWAIQAGHVVQSSLGYYIYPLIAVMLGVLIFGEKLDRGQMLAVALAVVAVVMLTWGLGVVPWISLTVAITMGLYGAVKKALPLGPVQSVAVEIALLTPLALGWLVLQALGAAPASMMAPLNFGWDWGVTSLLILSGAITALPLVLFSYAARRVEMTTLGLMFYLNPTLQFLCATLIFDEAITPWHMIAFAMIWVALVIYSVSGLRRRRGVPLANG